MKQVRKPRRKKVLRRCTHVFKWLLLIFGICRPALEMKRLHDPEIEIRINGFMEQPRRSRSSSRQQEHLQEKPMGAHPWAGSNDKPRRSRSSSRQQEHLQEKPMGAHPLAGANDKPRRSRGSSRQQEHLQETPLGAHPYAGAKDPKNQYWGYVHNPTILKETSEWEFSIANGVERNSLCAPLGQGREVYCHVPFYKENIPNFGIASSQAIFGEIIEVDKAPHSVKVFCSIYTHTGGDKLTNAIRQTWGKRCDGFMAASNVTVPSAATVNIPHFGQNPHTYEAIWQKVRSIFVYLYQNFLEDYDFYYFCGDDTYMIVENLKAFLESPSFVEHAGGPGYPKPVYTGRWYHNHNHEGLWSEDKDEDYGFYYINGGSGYVLNREALRLLVERVLPICASRTELSSEDFFVGFCLRKYLDVQGYDSRDKEGRERFFGYGIVNEAELKNIAKGSFGLRMRDLRIWAKKRYGFPLKFGPHRLVAPSTIAFHYVPGPEGMKRYERLLYRSLPKHPALHQQDCGG